METPNVEIHVVTPLPKKLVAISQEAYTEVLAYLQLKTESSLTGDEAILVSHLENSFSLTIEETRPGLTQSEQDYILSNPNAISMLMDYHDFQQECADSMGAECHGNSIRYDRLKAHGKAIVEKDPDIWSTDVLRTFGLRRKVKAFSMKDSRSYYVVRQGTASSPAHCLNIAAFDNKDVADSVKRTVGGAVVTRMTFIRIGQNLHSIGVTPFTAPINPETCKDKRGNFQIKPREKTQRRDEPSNGGGNSQREGGPESSSSSSS